MPIAWDSFCFRNYPADVHARNLSPHEPLKCDITFRLTSALHCSQALLQQSDAQKAQANRLFQAADYSQAIGEYDKALSSCPRYLEYPVAVLKANIAACHLKLGDWATAVESATAGLDALQRLLPQSSPTGVDKRSSGPDASTESRRGCRNNPVTASVSTNNAVVEIKADGEEAERVAVRDLEVNDERRQAILRLRAKLLLRRARSKTELGAWSDLQAAEDDYRSCSSPPLSEILPPQDLRTVTSALTNLKPRIAAARDREMGEMMGKLKDLGNGILRPFGLSTANFQMKKDEQTGGYSMNFAQNPEK